MTVLFILASLLLGALGAWLIARFGGELGLVDRPNERSSHRSPTPRGGGIGILATFMAGALWWHIPWPIWISASIISLTSLLGDNRDISIKARLTIQIGSAAIFTGYVLFERFVPDMSLFVCIFFVVFAVVYITATANYFNFMDGINGIAGLTGTIAFSCLGSYGLFEGEDISWVAAAFGIAAACLGFLIMNFPKAKVFMGDVGSILLGFLFASWVLWFSKSLLEFVVLTSFLFPFYIDEFSTLIVRIKEREKLTTAHRRHIYQILVNQAGLSHPVVTVCYGVVQIVVAFLAWLLMGQGLFILVGALLLLSALFFFGGIHIRRRYERPCAAL